MHDVWLIGDWDDIETSLIEDIANGEFEMSKPECTCRKLPHERTHAFYCPVQLSIKHCQSPRCSRRATYVGYHADLTLGYYCMQCKNRLIEQSVLIEDTVERM